MPLLSRIGQIEPCDTWPGMELAAVERFWDGLALAVSDVGRTTGSIYLLGYVTEMLLKTAYCRLVGVPASDDMYFTVRTDQSQMYFRGTNLHNPVAWWQLILDSRISQGIPLNPIVAAQIEFQIRTVASNWRETLRYKHSGATDAELHETFGAVEWLRSNYPVLYTP